MSVHVGFQGFEVAKASAEAWAGVALEPHGEQLAAATGRSLVHLEAVHPDNAGLDWSDFLALVEVSPSRYVDGADDATADQDARSLFAFAVSRGLSVVLVEDYDGVLQRFDATAAYAVVRLPSVSSAACSGTAT